MVNVIHRLFLRLSYRLFRLYKPDPYAPQRRLHAIAKQFYVEARALALACLFTLFDHGTNGMNARDAWLQ